MRFTADLCQLCSSVAAEVAGRPATGTSADPCVYFADIVDTHREDLGVFDPAIFLLGCSLAQDRAPPRPALVTKFLAVCQATFSAAEISFGRLEYCICATAAFLRRSENRVAFQKASMIPHVPRLLSALLTSDSPTVVQSIYELLSCARLLSFEFDMLGDLHACRILPVCHRALQRLTKEKALRMALYVLRNFAHAEAQYREAQRGVSSAGDFNIMVLVRLGRGQGPTFLADMVGVGIPKTLGQLARKKFGDDDIAREIEAVLGLLEGVTVSSTSWSEYKGELDSGVLEWSPCHTSVKFWKENLKRLEDDGYAAVKALGQLLLTATNEVTLAVACNDLGEVVRCHPHGALIVSLPAMHGVKERVMTLMAHENHDVSKHALTCVKKLLVLRWDMSSGGN